MNTIYITKPKPNSSALKKVLIKLLSIVLLIGLCLNIIAVNSQSGERGLIVSPIVNDLDVERGQAYEYDLNLENDTTNYNYNLEISLQSFAPSENDGVPELVDFPQDNNYSSWLSFDRNKLNIAQKQKENVKVKLSVPNEAKAGGYYFAIILTDIGNDSPVNDITGVRITQRIVSLLFVNVSGQVDRSIEIQDLESDQYLYDPFFDSILVKYKIRVEGGSYTRPNGNIYLDSGNQPGKTIFPLNPEEKIVIPQSSRAMQISSPAQFEIPLFSTKTASAETITEAKVNPNTIFPDWQKPLVGEQNIEARVIFVDSSGKISQASSTIKVFYAPWKLALMLLVPLILLIVTFVVYKKNRTHANL